MCSLQQCELRARLGPIPWPCCLCWGPSAQLTVTHDWGGLGPLEMHGLLPQRQQPGPGGR